MAGPLLVPRPIIDTLFSHLSPVLVTYFLRLVDKFWRVTHPIVCRFFTWVAESSIVPLEYWDRN